MGSTYDPETCSQSKGGRDVWMGPNLKRRSPEHLLLCAIARDFGLTAGTLQRAIDIPIDFAPLRNPPTLEEAVEGAVGTGQYTRIFATAQDGRQLRVFFSPYALQSFAELDDAHREERRAPLVIQHRPEGPFWLTKEGIRVLGFMVYDLKELGNDKGFIVELSRSSEVYRAAETFAKQLTGKEHPQLVFHSRSERPKLIYLTGAALDRLLEMDRQRSSNDKIFDPFAREDCQLFLTDVGYDVVRDESADAQFTMQRCPVTEKDRIYMVDALPQQSEHRRPRPATILETNVGESIPPFVVDSAPMDRFIKGDFGVPSSAMQSSDTTQLYPSNRLGMPLRNIKPTLGRIGEGYER